MRKIKDVLRLKLDAELSHERIAASLGISKGVVTKYVSLAATAGLDWNQVQRLDERTLQHRLVGAPQRASGYVAPDYGRVHQELRRKGMTLMLLWEEHANEHPGQNTHRYSQFCENYRRYAKTLKRSMRQIHRAGEKLFIDFAGPTVALADGSRAHIFVAALGASSYTFACATPRETMLDWLGACAQALSFFGGVPQLIVPDNPRAMIANPDRYEPRANDSVEDFARHYGTSVLPARPYRPQDKEWTSYCTLCGWLSADEPGGLATIATTMAANEVTTVDRLVQAAMVVPVQVARQDPLAAELVDCGRRHRELLGDLLTGEHAPKAQPLEATLEPIGPAHDKDFLHRERFAAPIAVPQRIELGRDLLVGRTLKQLVDELDDLRWGLADLRDWAGLVDAQALRSPAAPTYVH